MNKKLFNIGWLLYVILMVVSNYLLPVKNVFAAIMVLTIVFGAFNIYLWYNRATKNMNP
jgi:hypothetical protein